MGTLSVSQDDCVIENEGASARGKAEVVLVEDSCTCAPGKLASLPSSKSFSLCPELSHFLLTPFLFLQVISMVMVAVGVYARLMKHAGGL